METITLKNKNTYKKSINELFLGFVFFSVCLVLFIFSNDVPVWVIFLIGIFVISFPVTILLDQNRSLTIDDEGFTTFSFSRKIKTFKWDEIESIDYYVNYLRVTTIKAAAEWDYGKMGPSVAIGKFDEYIYFELKRRFENFKNNPPS